MKKPKQPQPKAVNYQLIDAKKDPGPYEILTLARDKWHQDLEHAVILLAWRKLLKADKDGILILGRCVKVSDLNRELKLCDFIVVLNREVWESTQFDHKKKLALMDHELCHAAPVLDLDGNIKKDERNKYVFRTRKHEIEEFHSVVKHHGCYKSDLEALARIILDQAEAPLFEQDQKSRAANDNTVQ